MVNVDFLFCVALKEVENMFSLFLSSYRNTRQESLRELLKAVETLCGSRSQSISRSPKVLLVFLFRWIQCYRASVQ